MRIILYLLSGFKLSNEKLPKKIYFFKNPFILITYYTDFLNKFQLLKLTFDLIPEMIKDRYIGNIMFKAFDKLYTVIMFKCF